MEQLSPEVIASLSEKQARRFLSSARKRQVLTMLGTASLIVLIALDFIAFGVDPHLLDFFGAYAVLVINLALWRNYGMLEVEKSLLLKHIALLSGEDVYGTESDDCS